MSVRDYGCESRILALQKGNKILDIESGGSLKRPRVSTYRHDEMAGLSWMIYPLERLIHSQEEGSSIVLSPFDGGPLLSR